MATIDVEPGPLAPHTLRIDHAAAGLVLSRQAGWNQTVADWTFLLTHGKGWGCSDETGALVATTVVLPYQGRLGWIGMVLVDATWRRQGLATRLLNIAIQSLLEEGVVFGLDATESGRQVYEPLGFVQAQTLTRMATAEAASAVGKATGPRQITFPDLDSIGAQDREAFGVERRALLGMLLERAPRCAVMLRDGRGHAFGRDGRQATQIGPVVAADTDDAITMTSRALSGAPGPVYVDVPDRQSGFQGWLAGAGFVPQRRFVRMLHQGREAPGDPARIFAIAGPELG